MSLHAFGPPMLVAAAALLLGSCSHERAAAAGVPDPGISSVAVAKVESRDLSHNLILTAEFRPYQEVDVMAKVAGYIREIRVDVGDRVKEGALLATLEIPEMADDLRHADAAKLRAQSDVQHAQDELQRTQAAHDIARLSFDRLTGVSEKKPGLIAQQELDDAHSKELVAAAQVSAAASALASAKQQVDVNSSDVQRVHTMMDYERVTAPFDGVITKRYADKGSMIQAGTASQTQAMPVVRISQNGLLRLILPAPESAVPTIHIGQQVEVRVPTLNRSFPGRVARFDDKLALATRTMDTEVDVPNPSLTLIPGMYAEVNLTLEHHDHVLTVPVQAVDGGANGGAGEVMVVTLNNRVETRKIALGMETANLVEVRSGLNEGDLVVMSGRASLAPGQEVKPKITTLAEDSPSTAGRP